MKIITTINEVEYEVTLAKATS